MPRSAYIAVWIEFVCHRGGCSWEIPDMFDHDWEEDIIGLMKIIEEQY